MCLYLTEPRLSQSHVPQPVGEKPQWLTMQTSQR